MALYQGVQEKSYRKFEARKYKNEIGTIFGQGEGIAFPKTELGDVRNNGALIYKVRACVGRAPFSIIIICAYAGAHWSLFMNFLKLLKIPC